jgi:hypothetical protein
MLQNEKHLVNNYRPVSLLNVAAKCFEKCVNNVVFEFLVQNKKLSHLQGAYQPGSSTTTQLLELYHTIQEALDEGKDCRFVFCDISKAFDRVWHPGVIHNLQKAGITGRLLEWLKSYLHERRQRVLVNGQSSTLRHLKAGVPQGSILGPLLFILYINDIVGEVNLDLRIYADDTTIFLKFDDPWQAAREIEQNLEYIQEWAKKWLITFNPSKTVSLTFSRKREPEIPQISMANTEINNQTVHKHLGLTLQTNGKWGSHVKEIVTKAKRRVDILRSLTHRLGNHWKKFTLATSGPFSNTALWYLITVPTKKQTNSRKYREEQQDLSREPPGGPATGCYIVR